MRKMHISRGKGNINKISFICVASIFLIYLQIAGGGEKWDQ